MHTPTHNTDQVHRSQQWTDAPGTLDEYKDNHNNFSVLPV